MYGSGDSVVRSRENYCCLQKRMYQMCVCYFVCVCARASVHACVHACVRARRAHVHVRACMYGCMYGFNVIQTAAGFLPSQAQTYMMARFHQAR